MNVEWVLERIGPTNEEVVIDKTFFYCGRMKNSDLVCLSLLVSREHCIFTKLPNGLYITDLGSSNGIFINGKQICQKRQIPLNGDDLIGIGCAELTNLDATMFVYKVKSRVVLQNNCDSSTSDNLSIDRHTRKEQSKNRRNEANSFEAPAKIAKKVNSTDDDDDDIQIIECTSTSNLIFEKSNETEKEEKVIHQITKSVSTSSTNNEIGKMDPVSKQVSEAPSTSHMIEQKNNPIGKVNEHFKQFKEPEIIDITDISINKFQNNNAVMEIGLSSSRNDNIKEHLHVDVNNKEKEDENKLIANMKIKQEPQNISDTNIPLTTVKIEPDFGWFSQSDIIEINDDDNSEFPSSQLFDKTIIKEECEENDNDVPQSSIFLDDEDEHIITILDSDDDNDLIIGTDKAIDLIQKVKIESDLEFIDVEEVTSPNFVINEADNLCLNNVNAPDYETEQSTAKLVTTLSDDQPLQSIEDQLSEIHKESLFETSTSKDPLINKDTSNNVSTENDFSTKDTDTSSNKDNKSTKKRGLEICEPHFMKPRKRTGKTDKKDSKKSEDKKESEHKRREKKKRHSSDSLKNSTQHKKKSEKSSKNKDYKKDKDASKCSSEKSSNKEETSKQDNSHKSCLTESNNALKSKNDINNENNISDTVKNNSFDNTNLLNQTRPKNKTTKVKVKVSTKTRGDMLCDAMQTLKPKPRKDLKSRTLESTKNNACKNVHKPDSISSFVIPRRQIPSSSIPSTSVSMVSQLNTPPLISHVREITSNVSETILEDVVSPTGSLSDSSNRRSPSPIGESVRNDKTMPSASSLKPALKVSNNLNTSQKKVLFKENIVDVREFPIEEGNVLRNIKDSNGYHSNKRDFIGYRKTELEINDFLARIFAWEPVWLEQQQKIKSLPPIIKPEDMQQLPNTFESFDQYYKRMEVLLLLETWQQLVKEYECTGNRYTTSAVLPCSIVRHSIRQMHTPNNYRYSVMVIHTLASKNQLRLQELPVYGDMIILEYTIRQGNVTQMRRAFAYVMQVQQQNCLKYLRSNEPLCKYAKNPDFLLTFVVHTRIIDEQTVQFEHIARLRSILYLRPHLRLIQGLQYVPQSPLVDSILNVNIQGFEFAPVTSNEISEYSLVTNEKLNARQMEAVIKFTNASVKMESKIGLLVGPPGTGKSKVIANLVIQILYGEGRYINGRPLRILVCAPSNAAIDEIVLRLLQIRGDIKEHRFKMVRIGRIESMHEGVKKISLTELAKRDAQKTMSESQHKNAENIKGKKQKLLTEIQALEVLIATNPQRIGYKKDLEYHRMKYAKLSNSRPEQDAAELAKLESNSKLTILQKANVIACTLSSCYTGQMETIFHDTSEKIATCIVDEATQCCEAETLIPLMLGVKSLILVGDPNQLPATVMSTDAKKLGLDRSLFTRAKEALEPQIKRILCQDPVITLNMQYRMVPAISHWPNRYFYGGNLLDMTNYKKTFPFQSYRVLNLDGMQDNVKFSNTSEAVFVGNLIHSLMTCSKINSWDRKITVGIITPYQNQKSLILSTIREQIKNVPENLKNKFSTEVNTIDSFQGQERDVIVMSLVRSSGIGFLSDPQRLCVALTRAKHTLIICGNFTTFQRDTMWKDLLRDARSRGVVARLNTTAKPNQIKPHIVRLD